MHDLATTLASSVPSGSPADGRQTDDLRRAIAAACRREERACVRTLLDQATLPAALRGAIDATARNLIAALRAQARPSGVQALMQVYSLSSEEGVALMCLAEALLRIPDAATRDALIRDKTASGDWAAQLASDQPLFVNAATWGLVVTGKLARSFDTPDLAAALTRALARCGRPAIRRAVAAAMRLLGDQFVTGETIASALARARRGEARGYAYSYDMLGEAAMTAADADRYFRDYRGAIHAIGKTAAGRGVHAGPGISIKLSALHPRYARAQRARVMTELLPRVKQLAGLAREYHIGLNIDAEEADRLELSLDILEALALDPDLGRWDGLGFVVQAYGKRCPFVIDWLVDLARRSQRRLMVRLVKGAYWDSEIKHAQELGLDDFPVYTRKVHTDVAYLACARRLLAARDSVFPQFATHNAHTLAAIYHLAGPKFTFGDYEFQCLHGMGEPLYDQVVAPGPYASAGTRRGPESSADLGPATLARPCRIYAPVGTHQTLLAYLVRRLLENGANSSFVNRLADPAVPIDTLVADPAETVRAADDPGAPHPAIARPGALFADRPNSRGIDLTDELALARLDQELSRSAAATWIAESVGKSGGRRTIRNPAASDEAVGCVFDALPDDVRRAVARAQEAAWPSVPVAARAQVLERAADLLQARIGVLTGLLAREAGKSLPNGVAEVREAIDFLRYYAVEARRTLGEATPLGPVACISPWNFPLAIFLGQVAAALVAGNPVLAKPAEETPLIAAEAVRLLHAAGVPADALQLLPGDGTIGAALVADPHVQGVLFTGSTEVAGKIQSALAKRLSPAGEPIPLVAETGGQNAMIVDSSALPEQVVADAIASAFDSAGQRCSALRVLCLQDDVADRMLAMLEGAMAELAVGRPDRLDVDVGPVIGAAAKSGIDAHIEAMRAAGRRVVQLPLGAQAASGTFVAPTLIEIERIAELGREVFGPVLHVLRYAREDMDTLIDAINATGYGLTFGIHSRIETTVAHVAARIEAGNLYVNRNQIGAVVGVQPFGGRGLSGTGPKAGGPLYLQRLIAPAPVAAVHAAPAGPRIAGVDAALYDLADWFERNGEGRAARIARVYGTQAPRGEETVLPGPVGERNTYGLRPRGCVLLKPRTRAGLFQQLAATLATGNRAAIELPPALESTIATLPASVSARTERPGPSRPSAALIEGEADQVRLALTELASRPGPVPLVQSATSLECARGVAYAAIWLLEEVSTSVNTSAAGGNASLMALA